MGVSLDGSAASFSHYLPPPAADWMGAGRGRCRNVGWIVRVARALGRNARRPHYYERTNVVVLIRV